MEKLRLLGLGAASPTLVYPTGDENSGASPLVAQSYSLSPSPGGFDFGSISVPGSIDYTPAVNIPPKVPSLPVSVPATSGTVGGEVQAVTPTAIANAVSYLLSKKVLVVDENGKPLPNALAFKDGERSGAVADQNGVITLSNIEASSTIFISHQGYTPQSFTMAGLPGKVILKGGTVYLDGLTLTPPPKNPETKKSNWLWWIVIAAGAGVVYNLATKKPDKTAKAGRLGNPAKTVKRALPARTVKTKI